MPSAEDPFYESVEFRGLILYGHKTTRRAVEMLPHMPLAEIQGMNLTGSQRGHTRGFLTLVANHLGSLPLHGLPPRALSE